MDELTIWMTHILFGILKRGVRGAWESKAIKNISIVDSQLSGPWGRSTFLCKPCFIYVWIWDNRNCSSYLIRFWTKKLEVLELLATTILFLSVRRQTERASFGSSPTLDEGSDWTPFSPVNRMERLYLSRPHLPIFSKDFTENNNWTVGLWRLVFYQIPMSFASGELISVKLLWGQQNSVALADIPRNQFNA